MSRHFYAVHWPYGVNTFDAEGWPLGTLVPFDSVQARDEYVAADRFDGNFHRNVPDYRTARRMMLDSLRDFRTVRADGVEGWRVEGVFHTAVGDAYAARLKADPYEWRQLFG